MNLESREKRVNRNVMNHEPDSYCSAMAIVPQLLYALIFPILNMFCKFGLTYDFQGKKRCIFKTLFYSSIIVYGTWNIVCVYLLLLILTDMIIDGFSLKTVIAVLFLPLLIWILIGYNDILYQRNMKKLIYKIYNH